MRLRPTTRAATRRASLALAVATLVLGSSAIAVFATGVMTAQHSKPKLALAGKVHKSLRPGASQPINVVLTNNHRFAVSVTKLKVSVAVRPLRYGANCSARRDFTVAQLGRRAYPIRLPAHTRRDLSGLKVRRGLLPRIAMRDLRHTNQNDCQRASLRLRYSMRVRQPAKKTHR